MIEARKRSFPVAQQRMHDFPDEEPSGDIHHEESLVEEVSLQIDSLPSIPPKSVYNTAKRLYVSGYNPLFCC